MNRVLRSFSAALGLAAALAVSAVANAGPAQDLVQARRSEVASKLKEAPSNERDKKVAAVLGQMFDFDTMGKTSLGKHWETLSEAQRTEFLALLGQLVQRSIEKNVRTTMNYDVQFLGEEAAEGGTLVKTKATNKKNEREEPVAIDYLLHETSAGWRAKDVITEGTSMVGNYKSQFRRIIEKDGPDALLKKMRDKLKKEGALALEARVSSMKVPKPATLAGFGVFRGQVRPWRAAKVRSEDEMGRPATTPPLRVRVPSGTPEGAAPEPPDTVRLRLSVTRAGLGLELAAAAVLGPVRLDVLTASLPGLSFPVDLSGGVPRFRHRRGALVTLGVTLLREPLAAFLSERIGDALGQPPAGERQRRFSVALLPGGTGATVGMWRADQALAFEVTWAPVGRDVRLVVDGARALGFDAPAHAVALRAMDAVLRGTARRVGSVFLIEDAASVLLRDVFPRAGARSPSTRDAAWGALTSSAEGFSVASALGGAAPFVDARAAEAVETAELLAEADDALAAGSLDRARARYLAALERAPHHREIALRLADLDRTQGERAEAALSTLVTAMAAVDGGILGGQLLLGVGDLDGARVAFESAAERETYAPLAARCLAEAAALADDVGERAALLARASARAPTSTAIRWRRLDVALSLGNVRAALADAEHLEAATDGPLARQEVLLRAGRLFAAHGLAQPASALFERALRYHPSNEEGLVGLGLALFDLGQAARAAEVLGRAIAVAARRGADRPDAVLALARVLADGLAELPLAIARCRAVPRDSVHYAEARALEARCLGKLGDRSAASVAWARMREALEAGAVRDPREAVDWLMQAARFETEEREDAAAAKAHLGVAIRLRPKDRAALAAFRRAAEALDELEPPAPSVRVPPSVVEPIDESPIDAPVDASVAEASLDDEASVRAASIEELPLDEAPPRQSVRGAGTPLVSFEEDDEPADAADEAEIERLSSLLRSDPSALDVVLRLAALLEKSGRDMDLFALLAARLEEGDGATREAVLPLQRAVLQRLASAARDGGRAGEAELYDQMRAALG